MTTLAVQVPDESILAHKELRMRPMEQMKLKHIRAIMRVQAAGREANLEDMVLTLGGVLDGWTAAEVDELTMDEMRFVMGQLDGIVSAAIPNANGSSSRPRSARTTRGRSRAGA